MLLSVIIPVYNVEKYVEECVKSILSQTFTDYEIILVDDGSTDESPEICDRYENQYDFIKVIHKENGGLSDARNTGTAHASGKYIVYVDSDDYINDKHFFEKLHNKTKSNPDLILYKFKKYYDVSKKTIECKYDFNGIDKMLNKSAIIKKLSEKDAFYCSAWSKAVKKSIIDENHIQFKTGILGEDIEWYYHILLCVNSFDFIDEAVITYRQRENSITSSGGEKNLRDNLNILEYWSNKIISISDDNDLKMSLLSSMGKLYSNLLINYSHAGAWRKQYKNRIKELSFLFKNSVNPRAVIMDKLYRVIGFNGTITALKIISKIKQ